MALGLIVCGVGGRMGGAVVRAAAQTPGVQLVAAIDKPGSRRIGKDAGELSAAGHLGVMIAAGIEPHLKPNAVIVDF
ncbi:MAG TPA: 4-hydroxy-tetrahydrodipicolinate reductase, partial [Candidatus Binatia bacterium]|nr:4-hydroxy-tetrahydrodipicolinate reductase [Candidatus Binatia bacterium]